MGNGHALNMAGVWMRATLQRYWQRSKMREMNGWEAAVLIAFLLFVGWLARWIDAALL